MSWMTNLRTTVAAAFLAAGLAPVASAQTIVEIAAGDDRFETLVAAVSAAGLVDTLSGPGPFTVYAPTDDAFDALPEGTVESLLAEEGLTTLTNILLYHVDDRFLRAVDFPHGTTTFRPVLSSDVLCITATRAGVTIGDSTPTVANVIIADIVADNGIIHVIDKVLIPGRSRCAH